MIGNSLSGLSDGSLGRRSTPNQSNPFLVVSLDLPSPGTPSRPSVELRGRKTCFTAQRYASAVLSMDLCSSLLSVCPPQADIVSNGHTYTSKPALLAKFSTVEILSAEKRPKKIC